jgi:uncharacterized membrane protein
MTRLGTGLPPDRIAQARAQRTREVQAIIARMEGERAALERQLATALDEDERARIETAIVQIALALAPLYDGFYPGRRG